MRALPAMLTIYIIGQGLPLAHVKIFGNNTYGYAALAIGMMEASYLAEIFRSGMQSVNRTYVESGISFGLPSRRIFSSIIIPIGVRCIIPALVNQYILIVKASSLVYLLARSLGRGRVHLPPSDAPPYVARGASQQSAQQAHRGGRPQTRALGF